MSASAVLSPPVCVLFALPEEAAPFLKRQPPAEAVRVGISGVGVRNAASATTQMLDSLTAPPPCLLLCGFAGGLSAEAEPGSLVLADRVMDSASIASGQSDKQDYEADSRLLAIAESVCLSGVPLRRGTLLTCPAVLTRAQEKERLAQCFTPRPLAADMETLGAVRVAQARGVPWLAARIITDGLDEDMPLDFNALADAEGNVAKGRVVQTMLRHPGTIPAVLRLGLRSARAARDLAAFVAAFLEKLRNEKP